MKKRIRFIILRWFCFASLLCGGSVIAQQAPYSSPGDRAEQLWSTHETQWEKELMEATGADAAGLQQLFTRYAAEYYKDRAAFFTAVSQGTINEGNAADFFIPLQTKYAAYYTVYKKEQNNNIIPPGPTTQGTCNPSCSNISFQNGTLSSWSAWYGVNGSSASQIVINALTGGACGSVTQAAGPNPNTGDNYHVELMTTPGADPVAGALIPYTPPLGGICARVGDGPMNMFGVGRLEQTYIIDAANPILTIQYAVVLQNPGHPGYQQPWFRIELLDQNGDSIPGCGQYFVVAGKGLPGFKPVWNAGSYDTAYCRPWTTAFVPLENYIGQCVTVRFTASDCAMGGHYGYAYVAATCSKLNLVSSSDIFCSGQKSASVTGPPGGASYQWTTTNGCTSGSTAQQVLNVTCAGTYKLVTASSAGAQCVDSFSITIPPSAAGPPPVACFKTDTVCSGNPTHFNGLCSNPNSGVKYYWDFYNNGIYEDSSGINPAYPYTTGGLYKARLHLLAPNGCSTDTVVTVAVDSTNITTFPAISDSIIDASSCNACDGGVYLMISRPYVNGTSFSTSYIVTNSFSNYRDSIYGFSVTPSGTGTCSTSVYTPTSSGGSPNKSAIVLGFTGCLCPGTYSFTIKSSPPTVPSKCNPGGLTGDTIQFTVGSKTANITSNVITAAASCGVNNGSATITGMGGKNPYIYTWSSGLGTGATKTNLAAGTYSVSIADSNNCLGFATVKINAAGQLPAIVTPYYISCHGQQDGSIKVKPTGGVAPYTYSWTGNVSTTDSAGALAPGTYSVTVTDAGGCSGTFSATILEPAQLRDSIVSAVTTITCSSKGKATVKAIGGSLPYTYKWSDGTVTATDTALKAGTTTITITDAAGCTVKDSVTVTATNGFSINAGKDTSICLHDSVPVTITGVPGGSTISWLPATGLSCSSCSSLFAKPSASTAYIVTVVNGSCTEKDTVMINVAPAINATLYPADTVICPDNMIQLQAGGGSSYSWKPSTGLSDSTIANPIAFVTAGITYSVTVSGGGCSADAVAAIDIYSRPPVPKIIVSGDTLYCETNPVYVSYQWYFNSALVPGATNLFYFATQSGNYNVAVTDSNGCTIAVGINLVLSGLERFSSLSTAVLAPNPAGNQLTVCGLPLAVYSLEISDVLGQVVQRSPLIWKREKGEVDISLLSPGIYFLQLYSAEGRMVKRFVKE